MFAVGLFLGWLSAALAGPLPISTPEGLALLSRDKAYQDNLSALAERSAAVLEAATTEDAAKAGDEVRSLLAEGEAYISGKYGPTSRAMAVYLSETLSYPWFLNDVEGFVERGRRAVALERYAVSNAVFFEGFIPYQAGFMDIDSVGLFLDTAFDVAAEADENGEADSAARVRAAAFEIAQADFIGNGARLAIRKLRRSPMIAEPQKSANTVVIGLSKIVRSFREFEWRISANYFGEPGTGMRANAEALLESDAALIEQAPNLDVDAASILLPAMVPLHDVQRQLKDDEALLVLVPGMPRFHVFVVTTTGFSWKMTDASWSGVQEHIDAVRSAMGVPSARGAVRLEIDKTPEAAVETNAAWLFANLLGSSAKTFQGKRRLLVAASGFASTVPLALFVKSISAEPGEMAKADWLVRHHAIQVIPAVEMLADRQSQAVNGGGYLGVGDPNYQHGKTVVQSWEASDATRMVFSLAPLPETRSEIETTAENFSIGPRQILLGEAATEDAIGKLNQSGGLSGFNVIHFATHGLVMGETTDFNPTGLAMTPLSRKERQTVIANDNVMIDADGLFTLPEIASLTLGAELVILSACDTASQENIDTGGFGGIASAFIDAGARKVYASHWPVNSQAAVELIVAATRGLTANEPDEALRQASLGMIAQGGAKAHPRYWAPFSVYGSP